MCFILGLIFGLFAISTASFLSSKTVHFIDLLQSSMFTTIPISLNSCSSGVVSRRAVDNVMGSPSVVESAISV